jgi:dihydrofolate reductase
MKDLKLLAPVSIDGFSSRVNIDMDWIYNVIDSPMENSDLASFFETIDCVVMNRMQYLSLCYQRYPFPVKDKQCFVVTNGDAPVPIQGGFAQINLLTISEKQGKGALEYIRELQQTPGEGSIWVLGDNRLTAPLLQHDMIEEINILRLPVILGTGIPFLDGFGVETHWTLTKTQQYPSGAILSRYCRTGEALAV